MDQRYAQCGEHCVTYTGQGRFSQRGNTTPGISTFPGEKHRLVDSTK
jgi:hypothetical protein